MSLTRRTAGTIAAAIVTLGAVPGCSDSGSSSSPSAAPSTSAAGSSAASASASPASGAPSGTDPAPYRTSTGEFSFVTPWGAWCAMLPRNPVTPNTPTAGCWEISGKQQVLSVSPTSAAAVRQVQQGFFVQLRGPALPAGSTLELDGVRCAQSATDLVCTAGEHGFTLRSDNSLDLR